MIDLMLEVKKNECLSLGNLAPLMEGELGRESGGIVLGLLSFYIQVEISHG